MKILHVLDHSIPLHSGYTFRTRSILNHQRALGWQTVHVTSPKQGNKEVSKDDVDDLSFYRSAPVTGWGKDLPAVREWKLIKQLEKRLYEAALIEKPDIIHAHSPALNGIAAYRVAEKLNIPFVYEIRAFWEDAAVDHGTCKEGDIRYRLTRWLENKVIAHANAVFTICEGLRKDLSERGIKSDKISVIPNAVNVEQFTVISEKNLTLLQELGLEGKKVLGFLGSFYAYEGLDVLVRAMATLTKLDPSYHLLLVGGGPEEERLKTLINDLKLNDFVSFTGRVPHHTVKDYYSLVDLLVYPRKKMRLTDLVTPLKPLEAMAQGKLVLASDVGGHKELIDDAKTGFLFAADSADALSERVLEVAKLEQSQLTQIYKNGLCFVRDDRNWTNSISQYKPVYKRLLGAKDND